MNTIAVVLLCLSSIFNAIGLLVLNAKVKRLENLLSGKYR